MRVQPLQLSYLLPKALFIIIINLFCTIAFGQDVYVKDNNGNALVGVTIVGAEGNYYAITDIDGKAIITADATYPLTFRYLGYKVTKQSKKNVEKAKYIVIMDDSKLLLDEIVLIGRTDIAQQDLAFESTQISPADIQLTNAQTTTDALVANSNVYIQKSQMGGGSPVIRGFEANKLLLVVDGVRMNNAIYRSGHLQNAITVDPAILENMEVIFGPGSLIYGSDALGGVVHFQSKELNIGKHEENSIDGSYYVRYGSSNNEKTGHVDLEYYGRKWASMTSFTLADFGDLTIGKNRADKYEDGYGLRSFYVNQGDEDNAMDVVVQNDDPEKLLFTGYKQYDVLQKFKFQFTDNFSLVWNNQFSTSSNIPRYDALTELSNGAPRYSQWNYGPQNRFLSSVKAKYVPTNTKVFEKVQLIVAYQNVEEARISSRFGDDLIAEQNENLDILNTTFDLSGKQGAHNWYVGLDANYNDLDSRAYERRYSESNQIENGLTRYPNGSASSLSSGLYAQYYFIPASWYKINAGIRYDYNQVDIRFEEDGVFQWPAYFYDGVKTTNQAINWSTGIHIKLPANFRLRALAGSSFRAPNIDDIAKIRINDSEISVPNDQLSPEKSINGELTLAYEQGRTRISTTGFYTRLSDAIIRDNFTLPNGESIFVTSGDTFNIVANINSNQGAIRGVSLNVRTAITKELGLDASLNFTKGDIIEEGESVSPLAHIPPTYGRLFLQYEHRKIRSRVGARWNGKKALDRFGGSTDNPEFATSDGSLSWYTLHATVEYQFHPLLSLQLGIDNILDQFYVPFASGLPGAGRHISVTVRGQF